MGGDGADSPVFNAHLHHLRLLETEIFLKLQGVLHHFLVAAAVCLGPERVNGGPFAQVQHAVLNTGFVRRFCHLAAKGVQLPNKVTLAGAAYGRIAWHVAHAVQINCKTDCIHP